jgi:hypothetical protein
MRRRVTRYSFNPIIIDEIVKMKTERKQKLYWKIHTPNLLKEIAGNNEMAIMRIPLNIFQDLLRQVADRAVELNDEQLNCLMIRLTLYDNASPDSPDYDECMRYLDTYEAPKYCPGCSLKCMATDCDCRCHKERQEYYNSRREFPSGNNGTHILDKSNSVVEASRRDIPSQQKGHVRWKVE